MKYLTLNHLHYLTDDFSIWQHTIGPNINHERGYALDDGARALLAALAYQDYSHAEIYLEFLNQACQVPVAVNFYDPERKPIPGPCSEDALGEAYWALGACIGQDFQSSKAKDIIQRITPTIDQFQQVRGLAYCMLGAAYFNPELVKRFGQKMIGYFNQEATPTWRWPENSLQYGNAILPYSMLRAAECLAWAEAQTIGLEMLTFLNKETNQEGIPTAIGHEGWYERGKEKALYGQQAIDPAYQILANLQAWILTKQESYQKEAERYLSWFWGNNLGKISLVNELDDSILDGLYAERMNINRGAENIICYLIAQAALQKHFPQLLPLPDGAAVHPTML